MTLPSLIEAGCAEFEKIWTKHQPLLYKEEFELFLTAHTERVWDAAIEAAMEIVKESQNERNTSWRKRNSLLQTTKIITDLVYEEICTALLDLQKKV